MSTSSFVIRLLNFQPKNTLTTGPWGDWGVTRGVELQHIETSRFETMARFHRSGLNSLLLSAKTVAGVSKARGAHQRSRISDSVIP